jgi:soluble lytic murein transglycosylase
MISSVSASEHAKELLGHKTFKQIALNKNPKNVDKYILTLLNSRLPKKYKKQANFIHQTILFNAKKHNLDPLFVTAIIAGESSFNPESIGPVQEVGLMQLRPHVAEWICTDYLHKKYHPKMLKNPYDSIRIGTRYLAWLRSRFPKNYHYIAAYNMGPGNIKKTIKKNIKPKDYPKHVMKRYMAFYKEVKK